MSDWLHGVRARPTSIGKLRSFATLIRGASHLSAEGRFPVSEFLEFSLPQAIRGFDFVVVEQLSDEDEACAYPDGCQENPDGPFIKLTNSVYEGAYNGNGRDRLTILHECAHVLLHRGINVHHRGPKGAELKPFENSEWQATQLAAELLMPVCSFCQHSSFDTYRTVMGISKQATRIRLKGLISRNEIVPPKWANDTDLND